MATRPISLGKQGEELALQYLKKQGYRICARNYRISCGEVDIVAEDRGTMAFVEVKTRRGRQHGTPFEAVTKVKQQRISMVALAYLQQQNLEERPARFDVVAVMVQDGQAPRIELLKNAFELSYGV